MGARRLKYTFGLIAMTFISSLSALARAQIARLVTSQELSAAIAELRSGKHEVEPDANKDDAGEHLAHLIRRTKPDQVDDRTIADIESLLDSSNDYIRFWAAASLGELGPRAKIALPKLLQLLPVVDCLQGDLTSASAVRRALMRIGAVKPPFPSCKNR
jgi:hypothetical protein